MRTAHVVLVKVVYAILPVWIFCAFFFQQRLAKKLWKNGFRWSRRDISGNIFRAPDAFLWLIYLITGRWRTLPDRSLRNQCRFWAYATLIVFILWFWLIAILEWVQPGWR